MRSRHVRFRFRFRAASLAAFAALLVSGVSGGAQGLAATSTHRRTASHSAKRRCASHPATRAHRARMVWTVAFPPPIVAGFVASAAKRQATSRHCPASRRHTAYSKHPTSGTKLAGAGTTEGGATTPGQSSTAAPAGGETTAPGGAAKSPEGESGETTAPPALPHVQVTAVEYHYTLSRTTVPAGKVVFNFVNAGQDEHNLNVLSGEGTLNAQFADTESKGVRNETIEMRPGKYTLFCSLPEHESKGMKATLTVE